MYRETRNKREHCLNNVLPLPPPNCSVLLHSFAQVCDCLGCCDGDPSCFFPVTYNKDSTIDERRRRRLLSGKPWTKTSEKYYEWYYSRQAKRAEEKEGGAGGGGFDDEDGADDDDDADGDDDDDDDDDDTDDDDAVGDDDDNHVDADPKVPGIKTEAFLAGARIPPGYSRETLDAAYDRIVAGVRSMREQAEALPHEKDGEEGRGSADDEMTNGGGAAGEGGGVNGGGGQGEQAAGGRAGGAAGRHGVRANIEDSDGEGVSGHA